MNGIGEYNDCQSKVFAFGDEFLFATSGMVAGTGWRADNVAKRIWERDRSASAEKIAHEWAVAIIPLLQSSLHAYPSIIKDVLLPNNTQSPTGVLFVKRTSQNMAVVEVSINWDLEIYRKTGEIRIWPDVQTREPGWLGFMGSVEIPAELLQGTTKRARAYRQLMVDKYGELYHSPPDVLTESLVQESMLFDKTGFIGGPIVVVQLPKDGKIVWIKHKPECQ